MTASHRQPQVEHQGVRVRPARRRPQGGRHGDRRPPARLLAARKLGLKAVPVVYADLGVEQARLLNLALNKIGGTWDEDL